MFGRLIPREEKFFVLFREIAGHIVKGATEFQAMLNDMGHVESRARTIKDIEHKADEVTHRTVELLHKTFITPLDRDDIHELIKGLDDILDFIEAASQRIWLYGITDATPEAHRLAEIVTHSADHVRRAVEQLDQLKNPDEIIKLCIEINRLENEADHVLRASMAKLFREEQDIRKLIKLKEIYELLETVTDRCEDVANIIEGIVLEYA
ncbi:MAG: DUF47 domain-containing protein [Deltaproteobacteria bacterium]|nr:DUF47 domain-containing protein [Deltaproteobacteria bacterium]